VAVEKSLDVAKDKAPPSNVIFDDSGNFVLYPTMAGIKVVNLVTNQLVRLTGKVRGGRYLHYFYFSLYPLPWRRVVVNWGTRVVVEATSTGAGMTVATRVQVVR
jgi:peptidylprolyl isomerase domain and WD repeat-containing protein 1